MVETSARVCVWVRVRVWVWVWVWVWGAGVGVGVGVSVGVSAHANVCVLAILVVSWRAFASKTRVNLFVDARFGPLSRILGSFCFENERQPFR